MNNKIFINGDRHRWCLSPFIIFISLLLIHPKISTAEEKWYSFVFSQTLSPDSPMNIGAMTLDSPSGKHGFVNVKDGHFVFSNGTPVRFWGTNICFGANFPDKKEAEWLAERIAFFGFNAVRLHHMDAHFEPRGIFEDTAPAYKNPQSKSTQKLSSQQLDRLDYLIFQLKKRGIYIDLNLLVSRHFTETDGVKEAEKIGMAAKPASQFDATLIDLQKNYAKNLLTHTNKYTGLRYCDDPAIALVEITNENSIINSWQSNTLNGPFFGFKKNILPDFYVQALDRLWNDWLKEKYGTIENLHKAWQIEPPDKRPETIDHRPQIMESSPHNQDAANPVIASPAESQAGRSNLLDNLKWDLESHNRAQASISVDNEKIAFGDNLNDFPSFRKLYNFLKGKKNTHTITIEKITNTPWHLQYHSRNLHLNKDKKYLLKFHAQAHPDLTISAISQQGTPPWKNLGLSIPIHLSSQPQTFEIPFVPQEDCPHAKVGFIIGNATGKIQLSDLQISEINDRTEFSTPQKKDLEHFEFSRPLHKSLILFSEPEQKDILEFYIALEKKYFAEMKNFLIAEIEVKVPITGIGGYSRKEDVRAQEGMNFIDGHAYFDHPQFPRKSWDRNDFEMHQRSILSDDHLGLMGEIKRLHSHVVEKTPFTVTEWQHSFPNPFAYETPVLMGALGVSEKIDGLFQFAFTHRAPEPREENVIHGNFDTIGNPQQLILTSIGGLIFLKNLEVKISLEQGVLKLDSAALQGLEGKIQNKTFSLGFFNITASEDATILLYSPELKPLGSSSPLILVILGEVKNKNSGWNKKGRFEWGDAPTLLKEIPVTITADQSHPVKIYSLDSKGLRSKELPSRIENNQTIFTTAGSPSPWFEVE